MLRPRTWNLGEGLWVEITLPSPLALRPRQIDRLRRYVEVVAGESAIATGFEPWLGLWWLAALFSGAPPTHIPVDEKPAGGAK